jgi:Spy/CpxP family protein refolding chaperone
MSRVCLCLFVCALLLLSGGATGQDKKDDPKKDDPKKNDPPVKLKGMLPQYWGQLGLSDEQKQNIYRVQNQHDTEIKKLEAKIAELKATKLREMRAVLTADQKKKLEEKVLGKDK